MQEAKTDRTAERLGESIAVPGVFTLQFQQSGEVQDGQEDSRKDFGEFEWYHQSTGSR